jgi:pyruvate formate lyase activating enzyme
LAQDQQVPSVAFTYNEPLVWFEYVLDTARLLHAAGKAVVLVTNGMINPEPLAELLPLVDAMNIDLKSMRPEFYSRYVGGDLEAVLETIRTARRDCHLELTNLVIPGRNDRDDDVDRLVDFVVTLGRGTPLHLSRYFPRYRASEPATPVASLTRAAQRAGQRLDYVYLGNVDSAPRHRDTLCPECGNVLVDRSGYVGRLVGISGTGCAQCGRTADLVLRMSGQP